VIDERAGMTRDDKVVAGVIEMVAKNRVCALTDRKKCPTAREIWGAFKKY
jgi:hypothetical protein